MTEPNLHTAWRWSFLVGCLVAVALVASPPFLMATGSGYAALPRWLFHGLCHQLPERSFQLDDVAFAVCHRCTGLYAGFTLGLAAWPHMPRAAVRLASNPRWIAIFFTPLLVDAVVADNTAASRFVTGLVASFPAALLPFLALGERKSLAASPRQRSGATTTILTPTTLRRVRK